MVFSPNGQKIASGSSDQTIIIWSGSQGEKLQVLDGHADIVLSVYFSEDSNKLVSGDNIGMIKIWNIKNSNYAVLNSINLDGNWVKVKFLDSKKIVGI